MARTVTCETLIARIRRVTDLENNNHVTDTDIMSFIRDAYPDYWDLLIEASPPEFNVTKVTFSTVADQLQYAFATIAPAGDFYKLKGLFRVEGTTRRVPVRPFQEASYQIWKPVDAVVSMEMHYFPCAPTINAAGTPSAITIEGHNGWDEWLVQRVAKEIKIKRQEDHSTFANGENFQRNRILSMGNRDNWEPQRIVRRRNRGHGRIPFEGTSRVDGYRICGSNLELVSFGGDWVY